MEGVFADLQEPVLGLALSSDGRRLAAGGEGGLTIVWDVASRRNVFERRGHGATQIYTVALSPDGGMLATGGGDAATRLWKTDSGELLHTFDFAGKWVRAVQFSPDGKILAVGGTGDLTVRLWDVRSFNPAAALQTFFTFYFPRTERHWPQGRETDSFGFGMWAAGNCANPIQDIRGWFGQSDLRRTANLSPRRARMAP